MNLQQKTAAWIGVIVAGLMVLFPPYYDRGGFTGGIGFSFLLDPLQWIYDTQFRPDRAYDALLYQLGTVLCFTLSFVLTFGKHRHHAQVTAFRAATILALLVILISVFVLTPDRIRMEGPSMLWLVPPYLIPGYLLFWQRLCGIAVILLLNVGVQAFGKKRSQTILVPE